MNVFLPADILIPDVESMEKWSVMRLSNCHMYYFCVMTEVMG